MIQNHKPEREKQREREKQAETEADRKGEMRRWRDRKSQRETDMESHGTFETSDFNLPATFLFFQKVPPTGVNHLNK